MKPNPLFDTNVPEEIQPIRNMLEQIQQQGLKQIDKEIIKVKKLKEDIKFEQNLAMFEFFYSLTTPKKERIAIQRSVRNLRDETWKEAMKKANNNEEKAIEIYDELIS